MAVGTARVVNAGAQPARVPPRILLPGLAHTQGGVSSPFATTIEHHAIDLRATSTLAPTVSAVRAAILGPCGMPLRCLIVDDRPSFSEAARELLTGQGVAVVATAASSAEAIQRIQELRPDVALVDIDLGEESGFDLARRLAADGSAVRVILISTHDEREFKKLIESSPTVGFLAKTELSAENLHRLLQRVDD
jgi:CheY-like chemotaxis protein